MQLGQCMQRCRRYADFTNQERVLQIRLIMPPHYDVEVLRDIKRSRQGHNRLIYFGFFIVFVFNCVFIYVMLFSRIWHIKCSLIPFK